MKRNKSIMSVIMSLLLIITIFCGCNDFDIEKTTKPTETTTKVQTTEPEVTISADVKTEAEKTKDEVENGEDVGTDELIIAKPKDESTVVPMTVLTLAKVKFFSVLAPVLHIIIRLTAGGRIHLIQAQKIKRKRLNRAAAVRLRRQWL